MRSALTRVGTWLREDVDRSFMAVAITVLGAVAFAGSASHILHVGAFPKVGVTGSPIWTVAGSLESLAAIATWEFRRRSGWDRLTPAVVMSLSLTFIILANLAAADDRSWAMSLPWAQAFAVTPPASLISLLAIAETRSWRVTARPGAKGSRTRAAMSPGGTTPRGDGAKGQAGTGVTTGHTHRGARGRGLVGRRREPWSESSLLLTANPGEDRSATIGRWVHEGHPWTDMVDAGRRLFGISDSTVKREIARARGAD